MKKLSFFERQIIESVAKGHADIASLEKDTDLNKRICLETITSLKSQTIISGTNGTYSITESFISSYKQNNYPQKNIGEIKSLVNLCIDTQAQEKNESKCFHLKKVNLNQKEKAIFNSMIYNLQTFLNQIPKNKNETKNTEVVFFGSQSYKELNQALLEAYS